MERDKAVRVAIIEDSLNDAEVMTSLLRNAGFAIRPTYVEDQDELRRLLKEQAFDLMLCALASEEPTLAQAHHAIGETSRDCVLLATHADHSIELELRAMQDGALDLVCSTHSEHLQKIVGRELANLDARRKLRTNEQSIREAEKRCHALLDSSRDAITYVHEGMHIYANPVYLETFGFSHLEDIEGLPIMDMVAPEDHAKFKDFLRTFQKTGQKQSELEIKGLRGDAKQFNATMEFSAATIDGEPCTQIIIRDRAASKELESKLHFLSKQDLLTGLYNRSHFIEELDATLTRLRDGEATASLLYLEPDNFKSVKANVGIAGADLVLGDIAEILKSLLPEHAVAARFGDQAFTVLIPKSDTDAAKTLADKVREKIEQHICDVNGVSVTTTCSIGICAVGESAPNSQEMLSRADLACELARKNGGNRAHAHNPVEDERVGRERTDEIVERIRSALDENRFVLAYQPIANLHGETQEKYDVLVRMRDADGEIIMPGQFIPAAEKSGLIKAIDRWVIARALTRLAERRRAGRDTQFFIKLSPVSLSDEKLLPWVSEQFKRTRLEGSSVVFQVSEATAVSHLKVLKSFTQGLKSLRCGFGLEHFGAGVNSFQLLKHLPVEYLKIDGSFMRDLATSKESQEKIKVVADQANSLGKTTIAEFVEDANSLAVLWQCGINYIQGNFLQAPGEEMTYDFQGEEA